MRGHELQVDWLRLPVDVANLLLDRRANSLSLILKCRTNSCAHFLRPDAIVGVGQIGFEHVLKFFGALKACFGRRSHRPVTNLRELL